MKRALSAFKDWIAWRLLRPISTLGERTESRLILHALERRKPGMEALLSYMGARGAEFILPRGDHVLRLPPDPIGRAILRDGAYERDIFERALALVEAQGRLRNGGMLLDVGANIGMHTIYGHLSGRFDRVLSIEPSARNFRFLEFNVRENGFENKTSMIRCAVGRSATVARLYLDPLNGATATLVKAKEDSCGGPTHRLDIDPAARSNLRYRNGLGRRHGLRDRCPGWNAWRSIRRSTVGVSAFWYKV
jgi:hypothetical protein